MNILRMFSVRSDFFYIILSIARKLKKVNLAVLDPLIIVKIHPFVGYYPIQGVTNKGLARFGFQFLATNSLDFAF